MKENIKLVSEGQNVTLHNDSQIFENKVTKSYQSLINLNDGSLEIKNITIQGNENAKAPIVTVEKGELTLSGETILKGNKNIREDYNSKQSGGGGAVAFAGDSKADKKTVTMKDKSKISECTANRGGGIYSAASGRIVMQDKATITNCSAKEISNEPQDRIDKTGCGGGIAIYTEDVENAGITITDDARITECHADAWGGGIVAANPDAESIIKDNATIQNNKANIGGGIYIPNGKMEISGSVTISENSAKTEGGGIYIGGTNNDKVPKVVIGGYVKITKNKAIKHGSGVCLSRKSSLSLNNSVIIAENEKINNRNNNLEVVKKSGDSILNITPDENGKMMVGVTGYENKKISFCSNLVDGEFASTLSELPEEIVKAHIVNDTDPTVYATNESGILYWKKDLVVSYVFKSGTEGKDLPESVKNLLPEKKAVRNGESFKPATLSETEVETKDGVWTVKMWSTEETTVTKDETYTAIWMFREKIKIPEAPQMEPEVSQVEPEEPRVEEPKLEDVKVKDDIVKPVTEVETKDDIGTVKVWPIEEIIATKDKHHTDIETFVPNEKDTTKSIKTQDKKSVVKTQLKTASSRKKPVAVETGDQGIMGSFMAFAASLLILLGVVTCKKKHK